MDPAHLMPHGGMQRNQPGEILSQLPARIVEDLRSGMSTLPLGWQQTHDLRERANRILQLITQLRFLNPDVTRCLKIAQTFEKNSFIESATKDIYLQKIKEKLDEITAKRRSGLVVVPQSMQSHMPIVGNMTMGGNALDMSHNATQHSLNNPSMIRMPNAVTNVGTNVNSGHAAARVMQMQPADSHHITAQFQRSMPATQLSGQRAQEQSVQSQNNVDTLTLQASRASMHTPITVPLPAQPAGIAQNISMPIEPSQHEVLSTAQMIASRTSEERKEELRHQLLSSLTDVQREQLRNSRGDILMRFFVSKARELLIAKQRSSQGPARKPPNSGNSIGQTHMQQRNSQTQSNPGGNSTLDLSGMLGQQAVVMKRQESCEQVVPASNPAANLFGHQSQGPSGPQGANLHLVDNQNTQPLMGLQVPNQMHYLAAQPDTQRRLHPHSGLVQQQSLAHEQAAQLQGQPGGLNAPNILSGVPSVAMNSPALSMLNRPMVPPSQAIPGLANPLIIQQVHSQPSQSLQPPQHVQSALQQHNGQATVIPMTNLSSATQLQHAIGDSSQMNRNVLQSQQQQRQRTVQFVQNLPPSIRQRLNGMNEQQAQEFIMKLQSARRANLSSGQMNGQNMPATNTSMHNSSSNVRSETFGITQPDQNNPLLHARVQPQSSVTDTATSSQQQLQQQHQMRQRVMDVRHFPRILLDSLQIASMIPSSILTWGALKDFVRQNQALIGSGMYEKLMHAQTQWFATHPQEFTGGIQALRAQIAVQHANQSNKAVPAAPIQNNLAGAVFGQAPQAQMTGTDATNKSTLSISSGPTNFNGFIQPGNGSIITPQDVQSYRELLGTAGQRLSDDSIRQMVWKKRAENNKVVQTQMVNQQQQQSQQSSQHQLQQQAQSQQPSRHSQAAHNQNSAPSPEIRAQLSTSQTPTHQNVAVLSNNHPQSGIDNMAGFSLTTNPSSLGPGALNAAGIFQGNFPRGIPSKAQIEKMSPQDRQILMNQWAQLQQRSSLRQSQLSVPEKEAQVGAGVSGPQPATQDSKASQVAGTADNVSISNSQDVELKRRAHTMFNEVLQSTPKGPRVKLEAAEQDTVCAILGRLWPPLNRVQDTFALAFRAPGLFSDSRIKYAMRAKVLVTQNVVNKRGEINEYLSLNLAQAQEVEASVLSYFRDMKSLKDRLDLKRSQTQFNLAGSVQTNEASIGVGTVKIDQLPSQSDANTKRNLSQSTQTRKASMNSKPPPAPIENKSFDWGAASPHGVPKYESGRSELTPDKLRFPVPKKRRAGQMDSPATTPIAQIGTPGITSPSTQTRTQSPEQNRKQNTSVRKDSEQRRDSEICKYKCRDLLCESSIIGFQTEDQLRIHSEEVHRSPEDPLTYLLANMARACGLDEDGVKLPAKAISGYGINDSTVATNTKSNTRRATSSPIRRTADVASTAAQSGSHQNEVSISLQTCREALYQKLELGQLLEEHTQDYGPEMPSKDERNATNVFYAPNLADVNGIQIWPHLADLDETTLTSSNSPSTASDSPLSVSQITGDHHGCSDRGLRINLTWSAFSDDDVNDDDVLGYERLQTLCLGQPTPLLVDGVHSGHTILEPGIASGAFKRVPAIDHAVRSVSVLGDWSLDAVS